MQLKMLQVNITHIHFVQAYVAYMEYMRFQLEYLDIERRNLILLQLLVD